MNYKKQIEPYLPGDYVKQLNDKKISDAPLNAYMYTVKEKGQQKQKGIIKVWMNDGTWETIPASIMIEWKTAMAPFILSNKRKLEDDSVQIHAWINPATYKFMLRIPRAKPEGTTIKTKKEWFDWLSKNHPDKGGDEKICQDVIAEGRAKGWC